MRTAAPTARHGALDVIDQLAEAGVPLEAMDTEVERATWLDPDRRAALWLYALHRSGRAARRPRHVRLPLYDA